MKKSPCDLYCTAFPSNHLNAAAKRQSLCYRLKSFRHLSKWKTGEPSGSLHGNATPRIDHPAQGMAAAAATFRRAPDSFPTRKYTPCCGFGFCDTNFFFLPVLVGHVFPARISSIHPLTRGSRNLRGQLFFHQPGRINDSHKACFENINFIVDSCHESRTGGGLLWTGTALAQRRGPNSTHLHRGFSGCAESS